MFTLTDEEYADMLANAQRNVTHEMISLHDEVNTYLKSKLSSGAVKPNSELQEVIEKMLSRQVETFMEKVIAEVTVLEAKKMTKSLSETIDSEEPPFSQEFIESLFDENNDISDNTSDNINVSNSKLSDSYVIGSQCGIEVFTLPNKSEVLTKEQILTRYEEAPMGRYTYEMHYMSDLNIISCSAAPYKGAMFNRGVTISKELLTVKDSYDVDSRTVLVADGLPQDSLEWLVRSCVTNVIHSRIKNGTIKDDAYVQVFWMNDKSSLSMDEVYKLTIKCLLDNRHFTPDSYSVLNKYIVTGVHCISYNGLCMNVSYTELNALHFVDDLCPQLLQLNDETSIRLKLLKKKHYILYTEVTTAGELNEQVNDLMIAMDIDDVHPNSVVIISVKK